MRRIGNRENFIEPAAFDRKEIERKVDKRIEFVGKLRKFIEEKEDLPPREFFAAVENFIFQEKQKDYFQDQPWQEKIDIFLDNLSLTTKEVDSWQKLYNKDSSLFFQEIAEIILSYSAEMYSNNETLKLAKELQEKAEVEFNSYSVTTLIPDNLYKRFFPHSFGISGFGDEGPTLNFVISNRDKKDSLKKTIRHEKNHDLIFLFQQFYRKSNISDAGIIYYVEEKLEREFPPMETLFLEDRRKKKKNLLPNSFGNKMQKIYDDFLNKIIKIISEKYFSEILADFCYDDGRCLKNFKASLRRYFFDKFNLIEAKEFFKKSWREYFCSLNHFYPLSKKDKEKAEKIKKEIFNFIDNRNFGEKKKIKEKLKPLAKKELILENYFYIASNLGKLEQWQNALIFFGPNKLRQAQNYLRKKVSPEEFLFWKWYFSLVLKKSLKVLEKNKQQSDSLPEEYSVVDNYEMAINKTAEEIVEKDLAEENFLKAISFLQKLSPSKKQEIFQKAPLFRKDVLQKYYPGQGEEIEKILS